MFLVSSCSSLCPIHWSHVLSWEWSCRRSSADRRCSNYIWMINNLIAHKGSTYIRDLTVYIYVYIYSLNVIYCTITANIIYLSNYSAYLLHNFIYVFMYADLTVFLGFVFPWLYSQPSQTLPSIHSPILFRVTSLARGQTKMENRMIAAVAVR